MRRILDFTTDQRARLTACFGQTFFDALPLRLAEYGALWGLGDFVLIEYYSVNCLFMCRSARYGDCVLKVFGCEAKWYMDEIRMLRQLDGRHGYVRAWACDVQGGAMLLERIVPGTTLKGEPSLEKRADIFADIWGQAHLAPCDPNGYLTYFQTAERILNKPWRVENLRLRQAAERMVSVCRGLYERYPQRLLLHGDLHGDNLLKNAAGGYTIVDPHGRIGPPVCDTGRFIANEFDDAPIPTRADVVQAVITRLSGLLQLPKVDIMRALFVDITLMTCWDAEDGPVGLDGVLYAEGLLDEMEYE